MLLVNTAFITGQNFETLELVQGSTIQSKHIANDILSGLKSIVGGEVVIYNEMMTEARQIATQRMIEAAEALGADAIVNVTFQTSAVMPGAAEVFVYGTAVKYIK